MANRSGFDRYKHNVAGYHALMRSDGVRDMLQGRADQVRQAAEGQVPADVYLLADTTRGRNRAGATIIGVPMRLEKRHRILGSAIDAAR